MSDARGQRASDLAAQQVEQIVSAAQAAAEQIREEALADAEEGIQEAAHTAREQLKEAGKQAIILEKDARRDAEAIVDDAQHDAKQIREKAQRSVDGRVVAAERAAAEVLEEARALSSGLHQLGKALEAHADRILRDVTAAHRRMQSDLRVGGSLDGEASQRAAAPAAEDREQSRLARGLETSDEGSQSAPDSEPGRPKRRNPFEEIDVPTWVGREG